MSRLIFILLGFVFLAAVQGDHHLFDANPEFTDTCKKCIKDTGIDETKLRTLIVVHGGKIDENDEMLKKFFTCCFGRFVSDNNEIVVNDELDTYVTDIFALQMGRRHKLAELLAKDCIKHCQHEKGGTKDDTATKMACCMMKRFHEFMEHDRHD